MTESPSCRALYYSTSVGSLFLPPAVKLQTVTVNKPHSITVLALGARLGASLVAKRKGWQLASEVRLSVKRKN